MSTEEESTTADPVAWDDIPAETQRELLALADESRQGATEAVDVQGRKWTFEDLLGLGLTRREALAVLGAIASGAVFSQAIREAIQPAAAAHGNGEIGVPGDPLDTAYVTSISGDGDTVDISPAARADNLNGKKVPATWSDLKTAVEGADRGDYITVEQGDTAVLSADALITVPRLVYVDLGAVEVQPATDTQDLWDVGAGANVHTGHVLPSSTYTGTVFRFDGDRGVINGWDDTRVGGKINPGVSGGSFVGHDFVQAAGGSVAGVEVYTIQHGGVYATFESADSTGYLNGNIFRGQWYNGTDGIKVTNSTGSVGQNKLDGCVLSASSDTTNVLDLAGNVWWGNPTIWDLGKATTGINFQGNASNCRIQANHPSIRGSNIAVATGASNNWVFTTDYAVARTPGALYCHDGAIKDVIGGLIIQEAAGTGNPPTTTDKPQSIFVENTSDGTFWAIIRGSTYQLA